METYVEPTSHPASELLGLSARVQLPHLQCPAPQHHTSLLEVHLKGLLMGSTPMGSARKRVKNEIFEFWSRFGSDFVSFGPGEVGIV